MPTLPKLAWQTVAVDTMPPAMLKAYNEYRKSLEAVNKMRAAFEATATTHLTKTKAIPAGQEPRFAYNWGKLAIAFAAPSAAKTAGAGDLFTF